MARVNHLCRPVSTLLASFLLNSFFAGQCLTECSVSCHTDAMNTNTNVEVLINHYVMQAREARVRQTISRLVDDALAELEVQAA